MIENSDLFLLKYVLFDVDKKNLWYKKIYISWNNY